MPQSRVMTRTPHDTLTKNSTSILCNYGIDMISITSPRHDKPHPLNTDFLLPRYVISSYYLVLNTHPPTSITHHVHWCSLLTGLQRLRIIVKNLHNLSTSEKVISTLQGSGEQVPAVAWHQGGMQGQSLSPPLLKVLWGIGTEMIRMNHADQVIAHPKRQCCSSMMMMYLSTAWTGTYVKP